jgi:hypothetical protein
VTAQEHRAQHVANRLTAQHLAASGGAALRQWALIAIFYAALHAVQATLLDRHGSDPTNHRKREDALKRHYRGNPGFGAYRRLYQRAHAARYDGFVPPDLSQDWADLQTVERYIV